MTSIALLVIIAFASTFVLPAKENLVVCQILNSSESATTFAYSQCNETYCVGSKTWVCEEYGNSSACEPSACSSTNCN